MSNNNDNNNNNNKLNTSNRNVTSIHKNNDNTNISDNLNSKSVVLDNKTVYNTTLTPSKSNNLNANYSKTPINKPRTKSFIKPSNGEIFNKHFNIIKNYFDKNTKFKFLCINNHYYRNEVLKDLNKELKKMIVDNEDSIKHIREVRLFIMFYISIYVF